MLSNTDYQKIEDALSQGRKLTITFEFVEIDDEIGVGVDIDAWDDETHVVAYLGANSFADAIKILNHRL